MIIIPGVRGKMRVAIVDAGVNIDKLFLSCTHIECLKYSKTDGFLKTDETVSNEHGTEIADVFLREAPNDVEIVSLQILDKNNKCTFDALLSAIEYCIDFGVNLINLSLGYSGSDIDKINKLRNKCQSAIDKGIYIVAASNNVGTKPSYPDSFSNVIGVTSRTDVSNQFLIKIEENEISFSQDFVSIILKEKSIVRKGNSYLCPLVSGWLCQYLYTKKRGKCKVTDFLKLLNYLDKKDVFNRIYVNRFINEEEDILRGGKTCYFANYVDCNNKHIYDYNKNLNYIVDWGFEKINNQPIKKIYQYLQNIDVFYIGVLDNIYLKQNYKFMMELFKILMRNNIKIITVFPVLNTYERIKLVYMFQSDFKTIYK